MVRRRHSRARLLQLGTIGSESGCLLLLPALLIVQRFQPVPCSLRLGTNGPESGCPEAWKRPERSKLPHRPCSLERLDHRWCICGSFGCRPSSKGSNLHRTHRGLERLVQNRGVRRPGNGPIVPSCLVSPAAWNEWIIAGACVALSGAGPCPKVPTCAVLVAAWNEWFGIGLFRGLKVDRTFQAAAQAPRLGTNGSERAA